MKIVTAQKFAKNALLHLAAVAGLPWKLPAGPENV
jgi:hypothetical protein